MIFWWLIVQFVAILSFLCFYINRKYQYWSNRGVKGPEPNIFQLGNVRQLTGQDPLKVELEMLNKYGRVYGTYTGLQPTLTVAEPELVKQLLIKDFHLFVNRRQMNAYHEMVSNSLFFTDGPQWKRLRTIASPTFSSRKLKRIVPIMNLCIDKFINYLDKLTETGDGKIADAKDVTIGFTIEVIAATSFGAQTNSNDDRTEVNPFVFHGLNMSEVGPIRSLLYFTMPKWFNKLAKIKHIFNDGTVDFFTQTTKEILRKRKLEQNGANKNKKNDLIQLLFDAFADESEIKGDSFDNLAVSMDQDFKTKSSISKQNRATLTEQEIIGVATGVFLAGFDTTSLVISSCIYELSLQLDLQDRLCDDLNQSLNDLDVNSDLYLDTVMNGIPYLDAVIKETLRKYPALVRLERRLAADEYTLGGIVLKKDQLVEISVFALHYNEKFYPDPLRFNPDRFMRENKHLLVPYTFIPFGDGPRNCIGMRYAYQEIKLCLARVLRNFQFTPTVDTPRKGKFLPFRFVLNPQAFPVKVEKRVRN